MSETPWYNNVFIIITELVKVIFEQLQHNVNIN